MAAAAAVVVVALELWAAVLAALVAAAYKMGVKAIVAAGAGAMVVAAYKMALATAAVELKFDMSPAG